MKIVGHRGARGLAPENTLAGLRKALKHGVDGIEIDLRVTGDGMVILHHDPELTDPNGDKHQIAQTDFATLKQHKPDLATLDEAIDLVKDRVLLYLEIKPGEPTPPIIKILKAKATKNLRVASFDQGILKQVHQTLPAIELAVLEKWSGVRATRRARQLGTRHIIMNQRWLWWGFIRSISRNYDLGTYTLNDQKKAARWQKHGLRLVITDCPDQFDNNF